MRLRAADRRGRGRFAALLATAVVALAGLQPAQRAPAMVGGAPPAPTELARSVVMILGSAGTSCTATAIGRDLLLTVAHCVQPGADYKIVEYDREHKPQLRNVRAVAIHPGFQMQAMLNHRATADVALLRLETPAEGKTPSALGTPRLPIAPGAPFSIAGVGVTIRGDGKSAGIVRKADLIATGKPGTLQIRLVDPATQGARDGLSACTGDSGAPVFEEQQAGPVVVGVVSWSTGPNNGAGCGG